LNKPAPHLLLRFDSGSWLTSWLMRLTLGTTGAVTRGGNLLRPTHAHKETTGQLLQRALTLIVGIQQLRRRL